jgi:hypothetical protein
MPIDPHPIVRDLPEHLHRKFLLPFWLLSLGLIGLDVQHLDVELQSLSGQGMIRI